MHLYHCMTGNRVYVKNKSFPLINYCLSCKQPRYSSILEILKSLQNLLTCFAASLYWKLSFLHTCRSWSSSCISDYCLPTLREVGGLVGLRSAALWDAGWTGGSLFVCQCMSVCAGLDEENVQFGKNSLPSWMRVCVGGGWHLLLSHNYSL